MSAFHVICLAALLLVLGLLPACHRAPMNKQEAAEWHARYASMVRWVGYRGSDPQYHHYIARVIDEWAFIRIGRNELKVAD